MQVVYLHGFASSPASSKATFLKDRLRERGIAFTCPDLNEPDFSTLTTSRMVGQVTELVDAFPDGPVVLFGSSLGAFVALHVAEQATARLFRKIDRLVFLAPALDFGRTPIGDLGADGMAEWEETGWWTLTHYASQETRRVHFELFRDALPYDSFETARAIPTLILQGSRDGVVDSRMVDRFAAARAYVNLVTLDDDHQLGASLERIWAETARFLQLEP